MHNKSNQENHLSISLIAAIVVFIAVAVAFMFSVGCSGNDRSENSDNDQKSRSAMHRPWRSLVTETELTATPGEINLGEDLKSVLKDDAIESDQLLAIRFVFDSEEYRDYMRHAEWNKYNEIDEIYKIFDEMYEEAENSGLEDQKSLLESYGAAISCRDNAYVEEMLIYADELYFRKICNKVSSQIGAEIEKRYLFFVKEDELRRIKPYYIAYLTKGEILDASVTELDLEDGWGVMMELAPEFIDWGTDVLDSDEISQLITD